jgi:ubiquinone/menaquinone biosynthesis C-methylase UbiE
MSRDLYGEIDRDSLRERLLKYTRKAFKLLPRLHKPRILDAGCGSGLPTIELAKLSNGRVVGIDIDQSLLTELDRRIGRENLSDRVETRKCSMLELDFPDEAFDIVWFEGATRLIGFEKALKEWRRLLKPNGFLVIHDEIKTVSNRREEISSLGYKVVNQFSCPRMLGG